jgi:hypothetical protein
MNSYLSLLKILMRSKKGLKLPGAGSARCFVLANGPSLKASLEESPDLLLRHDLICVNTFAMTAEYTSLKPAYYVMLDPFFWERKNETTAATFAALRDKTSWQLNLFVPNTAMKQTVLLQLEADNSNIRLQPFNYTVYKGFPNLGNKLFAANLAMPQSLNVSIAALFLAINTGHKEIILLGADHTWHENLHMSEDNILHTKVTHFYENDVEIVYKPFHKGADPEAPTQKAHEFFDIWSRTFYAYHVIQSYAEFRNVKVYNASSVSFIDAFKRKKLSDLK